MRHFAPYAGTVEKPARSKSMGAQAALGRRRATPELIRETFAYLADRAAGRLRRAKLAGRTVTVRVRLVHLRAVTRSITLPVVTSTTLTLTELAEQLARSALADNQGEREITLLAVSVCARNIRCSSSCLSIFQAGDRRRATDNPPRSNPADGE
jgi:hypothetical protein